MRDSYGRFLKGHHAPGPGRPPRAHEENYLAAVKAAITTADLVAVFKAALSKARGGDIAAARFIAEYLIGKPTDQETERRLAALEACYESKN